ncbi:glycosyltransferase family 2 protein [Brachyspira aalborgi]|uniref:Glycosyltransferase n=1 Tax=Brachyspira aalborgi TaxID=29522 RepID=A0A5C8ELX5_9SPIR|nr:glycosyltransferase [Brachyspira aalborgi]TXJ38825.1 glycosyltransferase [Brachyspira aalborgi]
MKINDLVSILVPVYNIEKNIEKNINILIEKISPFIENFEIIISDDGSEDNSKKIIEKICKENKNIIGVYSKENHGKGNALKRACEIAKGKYIIFCDGDMEINPSQLENFFEIMNKENADIVIGSKRHKDSIVNYSNIRKIISFVYFMFVKIFFNLPIQDTQTGLKLFKREAIINIFPRILVKAFAYDLEVLVACNSNGKKIVSAPVIVNPNRHFGFIKLNVLWKTFIDTLAIFYRLNIVKFYEDLFEELKLNSLVSIIIPLKKINDYIKEEVEYLLEQTYKNFEVIILPDSFSNEEIDLEIFKDKRIKIIETGNIPPALKRVKGVEISKGEILAFLDDDTYPEKDWLKNSLRALETKNINALGGPAITSPKDNFSKQISGLIYSSTLMSGKHRARYIPCKVQYVRDFPSCNFIITKELYDKVGGFNSEYWPGEDTILCNNIMKNKEKILYTPEMQVYHHRRDLFFGHFKQLKGYAWHRGYFVKKFGGNSFELSYFIPSIFLLWTILLPILLIFKFPIFINNLIPIFNINIIKFVLFIPHILYFICLIISWISSFSLIKGFCKIIGIFLSHFVYGFFFIKGFLRGLKG